MPPSDPVAATPAAHPRLTHQRSGQYLAGLWTLALVVVCVDQVTKAWAMDVLMDGRRVALVGDLLGLVLVRNPGAAFSFATGQTWVFSIVALVVTVTVIRVSRRLGSWWWTVTLGLILGGAVGNLIDRLVRDPGFFRGHVVDFIDYAGFFVGNVADIAIVGAAGAMIGLSLYGMRVDGMREGGNGDSPDSKAPDTSVSEPADGTSSATEEPS